ncbi:hypothetical protein NX784_28025 [Massilia pinisoli]|uniref:Transcriptional regulator n=1 Tax=Massilia pinisoli TaxID=1772194 RepID=A0ABT1ZZR4_9BURK|nr:hypothetical protein [Massilia pinisoli]MCS0585435.1 hypothetical protein [Massilia pinisoli]
MTLPKRNTLRPFADPEYCPPDHEDLRAVIEMLGYTGERVAILVGASDGRVVRRWLATPTTKSHSQIAYAAWRLLLLEAGLVRPPKRKNIRNPLESAQDATDKSS